MNEAVKQGIIRLCLEQVELDRRMQLENNKGKPCPYNPILCQEGWCSGCQIYLDYQGYQRTLGRR